MLFQIFPELSFFVQALFGSGTDQHNGGNRHDNRQRMNHKFSLIRLHPFLLTHKFNHLPVDPELLVQAAGPGYEVSLTLKRQGESACFTVRGPGTRLDAGEWDALLKQEPGQLPEEWNIPLAQQIAQLHGGSLMVEAAADGPGTVTAVLPIRLGDDDARLESPALPRQTGGFDPEMVAFSQMLPPDCFLPEELD